MVWSSAQPLDMPPPPLLNVGQWNFQRLESSNAFRLSFGLRWIDSERREPRLYTVSVIDDTRSFDRQLAIFRHTLWIWLGGTVVALIAILLLILRWSLAPLKQLGRELHRVESGLQLEIERSEEHTSELQSLMRIQYAV